jgi:hypothetical protein
MKNTIFQIIFFILLGLFLFSCRTYERADINKWESRTPEELCYEISKKVKWVDDPLKYWQSGGETEDLLTGDCEDFAILFMDLMDQLNKDCELVVVEYKILGKTIQHAIVYYNGKYYDPTSYGINYHNLRSTMKKLYSKSFEEIILKIERSSANPY